MYYLNFYIYENRPWEDKWDEEQLKVKKGVSTYQCSDNKKRIA